MPSFAESSSSSPILTIPPQPAHQSSFSMAPYRHQHEQSGDNAASNSRAVLSAQFSAHTRPTASRKRSRDEAAMNLNDEDPPSVAPIEPIKESEDDWIYGEGMVLIKPGSGYVVDASSQSGTWVEERAAEEEARRVEAVLAAAAHQQQERPSLRSHKSQRLEQSSTTGLGYEALLDSSGQLPSASGSTIAAPNVGSDAFTQPVVDDSTLHLGIGWRRINDDEHIQAAARGWARYIENHYAISSVSIRLESKGLQSYLVEAAEGYFLFAENLKHGRLVSRTAESALANLKSSPPIFDGEETMTAAETPKPFDCPTDSNVTAQVDIEMDMS